MREDTEFNEESHKHLKKLTLENKQQVALEEVQLTHIICGFHTCEFTYSLIFIYNTKVNTYSAFEVNHRCTQSGENVSRPMITFKQGNILLSCVSPSTGNKCPFCGAFSAM